MSRSPALLFAVKGAIKAKLEVHSTRDVGSTDRDRQVETDDYLAIYHPAVLPLFRTRFISRGDYRSTDE